MSEIKKINKDNFWAQTEVIQHDLFLDFYIYSHSLVSNVIFSIFCIPGWLNDFVSSSERRGETSSGGKEEGRAGETEGGERKKGQRDEGGGVTG